MTEVIMRSDALVYLLAKLSTVPGGFGYMKLTGMAWFGLALGGATYYIQAYPDISDISDISSSSIRVV